MIRMLATALAFMSASCAARPMDGAVLVPATAVPVVADDSAQTLFDDAVRWSRASGLETGGCFHVAATTPRFVLIDGARERVVFRRRNSVFAPCDSTVGMWHTHWLPASDSTAGCQPSPHDPALMGRRPLGIVVCGVGRDSIIGYVYDASKLPKGLPTGDALRCEDESAVSLRRPEHACSLIAAHARRR